MNPTVRRLTTIASLALLIHASGGAEESQEVPKAPQAVLDTLHRAFPGANITDCDQDRRPGATGYEVKLIDAKGDKHTLHIAQDGTLVHESPQVIADQAASNKADKAAVKADKAAVKADRAADKADAAADKAVQAAADASKRANSAGQSSQTADRAADQASEAADKADKDADRAGDAATRAHAAADNATKTAAASE